MRTTARDCAEEVVDVVPAAMRAIRAEIRAQRRGEITVPQLRTLSFLKRCEGTTLSAVADHIGLTLPSMSKLIDGLVARKLVTRHAGSRDRRCVTLALTGKGEALLKESSRRTRNYLADQFAPLPESDLRAIVSAMRLLRPVFSTPRDLGLSSRQRKSE